MCNNTKKMQRKETYSVDAVLSQVVKYDAKVGKNYADFDGDLIKMESQRYRLFKRDGCTCVECGLEGTYFIKERHNEKNPYHFNLYGVNENGAEILITKDHILARANGGKDIMSNYQVMCFPCNNKKGKTL